jgi:hypothetical protein
VRDVDVDGGERGLLVLLVELVNDLRGKVEMADVPKMDEDGVVVPFEKADDEDEVDIDVDGGCG